ncbi:hypothetical protein GCM10025871_15610 [Deinococcus metallilatus]|nr:hypothetical protein GCM10025871_15610 [Deinococcus metallilatus]
MPFFAFLDSVDAVTGRTLGHSTIASLSVATTEEGTHQPLPGWTINWHPAAHVSRPILK